MRGASPTTAQVISWTPPLAEVCFQSSQWGALSPRPWCSEMYDFALVGCKPEATPCRPFLYGIHCLLEMSLYGVQRASSKTDRQVIDKECFEDVLGNTRRQLINLQSKTFHSQDTASCNTFLWVEFVRDCCPNSDSDSPVPEKFWHKNRQSASEANPVKVSNDARLSHKLSPSQRRDQLPVASEQRHPRDIFQGSPSGRSCYDVFWNHTGFCLVSCIFQDTRLSGY